MNSDMAYMLDVIDQLTFDKETDYHLFDEGLNWVKVTSSDIEVGTGFSKVKVRMFLSELKSRKLITNNPKWSGANSGWYMTTRGHEVAVYMRS